MRDYQGCVTTWQTHWQTDAGQSDPYVLLYFASDTIKLDLIEICIIFYIFWNITVLHSVPMNQWMFIIQVFFPIQRIFVQIVATLPKIAKHRPIEHGIIANIFVILWTTNQCVKCSTHDLETIGYYKYFQFLTIFLHKMLLFTPKIARFGYIRLRFIADIFS